MGRQTQTSKVAPTAEPTTNKAGEPDHSVPDKLGTLANLDPKEQASSERTEIARSLEVVKQSYHWFSGAAKDKLNKLRSDLRKEDEPDWFSTLASGLLEMAIGAGAAGAGAHLANKVVAGAGEGVTEFVKVMFEGGIDAGLAAGRSKLAAGKDDDVIDPFIDAQIEAVDQSNQVNQTEFIMRGQDSIKTRSQATALRETCERTRVVESADKQYEASRDSWVSYLAQSKFGAIGSRGGAVQPDVTDAGSTTTNMTDRARRKQTNKHAPGFVPEEAPDLRKAIQGDADGVLVVAVQLPAILAGLQMTGRPKVEYAFLNGVNGALRAQYENRPLGSLHIPRQLAVRIDGETQGFELGINEKGELGGIPRAGGLHDWLVARSTVAHPENASKTDFGKVIEGTRLLLDELVAPSIRK